MKNFEKYEKELLEIAKANNNPCVSKKDNKPHGCTDINCSDCLLSSNTYGCRNILVKWLYEEYKEPIKLSRLEYELLKYFIKKYKYIGKGEIVSFSNSDDDFLNLESWGKDLFDWMKEEDEFLIKDILNNCMVVEDE